MKSHVACIQILLLSLMLYSVSSEHIKSKIYDSIEGVAACFRRLNGTHQFGCGSRRLGNVGVLHKINDNESLEWLLEHGEAVPYMVIMYPPMFTRDIVLRLSGSGKVNGIALLNNGSQLQNFTHEDTCPNRYSGLFLLNNETCDMKDAPWNPHGSRLMLEDLSFPIFYVKKDFEKIEKCYSSFNAFGRNRKHDRSLCAMEMKSFMFATTDSATCIRRSKLVTNFNPMKFCDPLGGRNVWSTLFPRNKNGSSEQNSSVWVLASRMDSASLFDGVTPGAVSPATGIVALLSTANVLSKIFNDTKEHPKNNILFVLFNGESFDYVGSSRMLWDMKKGRFPIEEDDAVAEQPPPLRLEHLAYFVELSHLTDHYRENGSNPTLVFHTADKNRVKSHVPTTLFVDEMLRQGATRGLRFLTRADGHLPPASLQTFLAHASHDAHAPSALPGVVIADHFHAFNTPFYHSVFDDGHFLHYEYQEGNLPPSDSIQSFVANFSTALAHTLYAMLTGKNYTGAVEAEAQTVDELLHCYVDKLNCSLFQQASHNVILNDIPPNYYIGVGHWREPNPLLTSLTGQTLAYLTGEPVNKTEGECHNNPQQQVYQYIWMKGDNDSGVCIKTTMNFSAAVSPAFEEPDYDWSSGQFSTWTESTWSEMSARIFLKPSHSHEVKILSIGIVVFSLSFILVYFLNARSHILFGNTLGAGGC